MDYPTGFTGVGGKERTSPNHAGFIFPGQAWRECRGFRTPVTYTKETLKALVDHNSLASHGLWTLGFGSERYLCYCMLSNETIARSI